MKGRCPRPLDERDARCRLSDGRVTLPNGPRPVKCPNLLLRCLYRPLTAATRVRFPYGTPHPSGNAPRPGPESAVDLISPGYAYAAKGQYGEAANVYQKQISLEGETTSVLIRRRSKYGPTG